MINTLHTPASATSTASLQALAESSLNAARDWTTEPAMAPAHEAKPLWSELLRFGLHGAVLGIVTALSVLVFDKLTQFF